jgi:Putative auto-transporter adhesin, head GIN domain
MKNVFLVLLLAVPLADGWAQQTEIRNVDHFTGVGVSEGIDVYLKKGDQESVRVETGGIPAGEVITDVSGNYLKIHMRNGHHNGGPVKVYVTYRKIDKLYASSAGNIYGEDTLVAESLKIESSSAATIEIRIEVGSLRADISSASDVELEGTADKATVEVTTAGELEAYDLEVNSATLEAASAGSMKITVKNSIEAEASSGGSIRYRGNPMHAITHSSSGGSVRKTG